VRFVKSGLSTLKIYKFKMDNRKIKKVKIKEDYMSAAGKDKSKTVFALKNEVLNVNTQRDNVLIVKGKNHVFPINIKLVDIVEYEK